MAEDRKRFLHSLVFPAFFLFLLWVVKFFEFSMELSFVGGGVYPRHLSGLKGILFSPLIHSDWKHLVDNSMPVFFLSLALFYFYRDIAYKIWILIYFMGGILLWGVGRQAYHIGASGLIYGLAAFLFLSGLIRRVRSLTAISLLVVFWYGSMVWGLLPFDFEVSFEAHALRWMRRRKRGKKILLPFPVIDAFSCTVLSAAQRGIHPVICRPSLRLSCEWLQG
jgi:membrane associated rhomboid family serine protease